MSAWPWRTSTVATVPSSPHHSSARWVTRRGYSGTRLRFTAAQRGATFRLVWVYCDADSMHGYLRHRSAARDAGKLANWNDYIAGIDLELRPPAPHVVIDNSASSKPLQDQAKSLVGSLVSKDAEQQ